MGRHSLKFRERCYSNKAHRIYRDPEVRLRWSINDYVILIMVTENDGVKFQMNAYKRSSQSIRYRCSSFEPD